MKEPISKEQLLSEGWREWYDDILDETILLCPVEPLEFVQHPKAPLFKTQEKGNKIIADLLKSMAQPNFKFTEDVLEIYRQASLVSLWFFLKFVAGYAGPYDGLNDSLHRSMCNYRQRQLHPGARGSFFIPRSCYKSTIATHGANAWEILRDPQIRIGMISSKVEMAEMFMHATMRIFDSNPLMLLLFPTFCPARNDDGQIKNGKNWTNKSFVIPSRRGTLPEPTMKCAGAAGSAQGIHCDLLSIDDIVGEKQLNAFHDANDEMVKIDNWMRNNVETLLISPKYSRVFLAATRYSLSDPYEQIMWNAFEQIGCWDDVPYTLDPTGVWSVYYRQAVERDRLIFPEKISFAFLERLKETSYWGYITQYMNNAHAAELSEFAEYNIKEATIDFQTGRGCSITYQREGRPYTQNLGDCEVYIGVDPAASETRSSAQTSRTAIVVQARDAFDNRTYIDGAVGYFSPVQFYGHLFRLYSKYAVYIKGTNFESGGPFKFVYNSLIEEQKKRSIFIGLRKLTPLPNKNGKIRNFLQPLLEHGQVYACDPIASYIRDEVRVFPGGNMKDTLDAMELADRFSIKPLSAKELQEFEREKNYRSSITNRAGY